MQLERASRLALEFDGVSWGLCHDRTPFIEMSLSGISLVNLRNHDQSGMPLSSSPLPLVPVVSSLLSDTLLCLAPTTQMACVARMPLLLESSKDPNLLAVPAHRYGVACPGNSKLVIQSAVVRDTTSSLPAAPGTEEGKVLTLWNPDESWSRDALLRVNAVLGPATRTHIIYEHIEVVVHPLGVHLNEAVAQSFWVSAPSLAVEPLASEVRGPSHACR